MPPGPDYYSRSPEVLLVGLARSGDRKAFEALVNRRQAWIRNLLRRCCGDVTLADDLAQQTFLQAWSNLPRLQRPSRFGAWLKRVALNVWLQQRRKPDPLAEAVEWSPTGEARREPAAVAIDLDRALATLPEPVRLCIVLSYHERMTHQEIAEFVGLPLGTVKSHIRRGSERLRERLSAYRDAPRIEEQP